MYLDLFEKIIPLSKSNTPQEVVNEWDFIDSYMNEAGDNCICGHDINEVCNIKNIYTDKVIKVGNCCVRYFIDRTTDAANNRFSMIGKLNQKNTRKKYQDIFDLIVSVSKSAAIIFNQIKLNTDPETGIAVMSEFETLNDSQRRANNRRLVELRDADIVLKIRTIKGIFIPKEKYSYMINPHLMKPWKYDDAKKLWKALKVIEEQIKKE